LGCQARDAVGDLVMQRGTREVADDTFDTEDLLAVREVEVPVQVGTGPDPPILDPAVALIRGFVLRGEKTRAPGLRCPCVSLADCPSR